MVTTRRKPTSAKPKQACHFRRRPKGTWMRLKSAELLRAVVGPEETKKISARRLALAIDKTPGFIDHLLAGRRSSCKPSTADRIAQVLGVPTEFLFDENKPITKPVNTNYKAAKTTAVKPTSEQDSAKRKKAPAA